jgi:LysM repeat protein
MPWITDFQRWLSESESLNNAQMVANHFSDWSPEAISALCGNMRHESSINPDMYEYGYIWEDDRGYGLVQWTPRSKYWDWAVARGLSPRLGDSQLARIDYEVEEGIQWYSTTEFPLSFAEFRANSGNWSTDYLTEAFTWNYERPNRQAGEDSMSGRQAFARKCLTELDFSGTGGGGSNPTPSRTGVATLPNSSQYEYEKEGQIDDMTYYKVKKGDNLSTIAKNHSIRMDLIKRVQYKEIANANKIKEGEILLLPNAKKVSKPTPAKPKTHKVRAGENLSSIAKRYGTSWTDIATKNDLKNPDLIKVGQVLKI